MGQLLVTLIVPPIIGVVTYLVVRLIWSETRMVPVKYPSGATSPITTGADDSLFEIKIGCIGLLGQQMSV
jgi:hypothetical protein